MTTAKPSANGARAACDHKRIQSKNYSIEVSLKAQVVELVDTLS
jgi:hypothetical protein